MSRAGRRYLSSLIEQRQRAGRALGSPATSRLVDSSYTNGALTAIAGYAPSLSYSANGTLASVTHANSVVWSQTADPNSMGTGPRSRSFGDGDYLAEMLKQHEHIQQVASAACKGALPPSGPASYNLSGLPGIPKYVRDYSTLATAGRTGNLAVTYLGSLGSYDLRYSVSGGTVRMNVTNHSTAASALRPPVIGYTTWWDTTIGTPLNQLMTAGQC